MKLSAEVILIAQKIQKEIEKRKESARRFARDSNFVMRNFKVDRVDVCTSYETLQPKANLGKPGKVKQSNFSTVYRGN